MPTPINKLTDKFVIKASDTFTKANLVIILSFILSPFSILLSNFLKRKERKKNKTANISKTIGGQHIGCFFIIELCYNNHSFYNLIVTLPLPQLLHF